MSHRSSEGTREAEYAVERTGTVHECAYCGRPFRREELLALHRGQAHAGELTADERAAYESAYDEERAELRRFRLKAVGLLVVLYFGFLMVYALV